MPPVESADLALYYAPRTRSFTALWLMEELSVPYRLESFDLNTGRHKQADFLARNALGKVPVVQDGETPVSELGAMAIYLADKYAPGRLAPALDAPQRAAYLRWMFVASALIEPGMAQKFHKWEGNPRQLAWGSFDEVVRVLRDGLPDAGYLLGEQFSAADVVLGSALRFGLLFGAFEKGDALEDYTNRATDRDAFRQASEIEAREGERFPMKK